MRRYNGTAWVDVASSGTPELRSANAQTVNYTLAADDPGKVVEVDSATAKVVTVPPNASVVFPVGTILEVVQIGAGGVTLSPGVGVTLLGATLATAAVGKTLYLRKRATDTWVVGVSG